MAEIVNLRLKRKAKARAEKEKKAEANRRLYGQTKHEKKLKKREEERASKHIDGHKLESDD